MEPLSIGLLAVSALLILLVLGVPVAVALGTVGCVGMWLTAGDLFLEGQLRSLPFSVTASYAYAVMPLFVLMGVLVKAAGVTRDLFLAAELMLWRVRGSLYFAVISGSALFAAVSGSTIVNSVVFTRVAYPEMLRLGYDRSLAIGSVAASGSFAAMIPPSLTMVIYAIITEQSIGQLFMAGVIPGLLSAAAYMLLVMLLIRWRPSLAPRMSGRSFTSRRQALAGSFPLVLLAALVLGGLYAGWFPPSAAGAVGAAGALVIAFARHRGRTHWLIPALKEAVSISCVVFAILIGGLLFSRMLVVTGVVNGFVVFIEPLVGSPAGFLILVSVMYLVLGMFLDTTSMMVVTLPFIYPAVVHFGIDPIWFGVILVKLIEISVITPPIGLNLFAVMSAVDRETRFSHVIRGVLPFLVVEVLILALLIACPALSNWLPQQMTQ
uniref:TRAP transporter large permease protein n=1 Tax=Marinobacter nauticus TaxID=2743 RepID=A0A455W5E9_MARNT|nr:C4-dicarboxylate ABC transporter permease [Marinobacter nauticus]